MNLVKRFTLKHILVVVVLLIWGVIGYRYFSLGKTSKEVEREIKPQVLKDDVVPEEVVVLYKPVLDPFLSTRSSKVKVTVSKRKASTTKSKRKNKLVKKLIWPSIRYMGFIQKYKGKKVALLKVNQRVVQLKEYQRDTAFGFRVQKVYKDSVVLGYKNNYKTITVQK